MHVGTSRGLAALGLAIVVVGLLLSWMVQATALWPWLLLLAAGLSVALWAALSGLQGQVLHWKQAAGQVQDLQKQLQEAVTLSAVVLDAAQEPMLRCDAQGRILEENGPARMLFPEVQKGTELEQLPFYLPEGGQRAHSLWQEVLQTKSAVRKSLLVRTPAGDRPVRLQVLPHWSREGRLAGLLVSVLDLGWQAEMEQLHHDLTQQQQQLLQHLTGEALIELDAQGKVQGWGTGAEQLYGYPAAEMLGQDMVSLFPSSETHLLGLVRNPNGPSELQTLQFHQDGSTFPVTMVALPSRETPQGSRQLMLVKNNTPAVPAGEELQRLNQQLSNQARQLLQDLQEQNQALEAANRDLQSFAHSVAHDLRTPLRGLDGFSQALIEDYGHLLDETAHQYLRRIRKASQRMGDLLDDMLDFTRVTRAPMNPVTLDFTQLTQQVLQAQLATGHQEIEVHIEPDMRTFGDPGLLRTLLQHLLANGLKFSAQQELPELHVGTLQQNGEQVFFVRDNGVGFDMRFANQMFQPFHRLHANLEFEGNGMGLAVVKRILDRHQGHIWAESEPGQGATFFFTLPEASGVKA